MKHKEDTILPIGSVVQEKVRNQSLLKKATGEAVPLKDRQVSSRIRRLKNNQRRS